MAGASRPDERAARHHGVILVISLFFALGPLIGAIWSAVDFFLQRHQAQRLHLAGEVIEQVPRLDAWPIVIGFVAFPIGMFFLVRATLWFSHHVTQARSQKSRTAD